MSKESPVGFVGEFVMEETGGGFGKLAGVKFRENRFEGFNHLLRCGIAELDLGLVEGLVGWELLVAPEFVEFGEEEHGAEVANGPEGANDSSDSGLEKSDR